MVVEINQRKSKEVEILIDVFFDICALDLPFEEYFLQYFITLWQLLVPTVDHEKYMDLLDTISAKLPEHMAEEICNLLHFWSESQWTRACAASP